mmetsp:Transcript_33156/g.102751  ORF Transcript_33156/g.102751 Transcript_33156/m.102751 type:complete len:108 (+) Transcript_33156:16-339(+)
MKANYTAEAARLAKVVLGADAAAADPQAVVDAVDALSSSSKSVTCAKKPSRRGRSKPPANCWSDSGFAANHVHAATSQPRAYRDRRGNIDSAATRIFPDESPRPRRG